MIFQSLLNENKVEVGEEKNWVRVTAISESKRLCAPSLKKQNVNPCVHGGEGWGKEV